MSATLPQNDSPWINLLAGWVGFKEFCESSSRGTNPPPLETLRLVTHRPSFETQRLMTLNYVPMHQYIVNLMC